MLEACLGLRIQPQGEARHRELIAIKTQPANSGVVGSGKSSRDVF